LYLLDEPTTGLHFDDILKLLSVLNSLVEQGNTVVVIEHNLDVIKTADWIIDLGPEAGAGGGQIVVQGTPEDVVSYATQGSVPRSWTGELLAPVLEESRRGVIETFDAESVSAKKQGDVSIEQLGKSAKLPWETDGRKWHIRSNELLIPASHVAGTERHWTMSLACWKITKISHQPTGTTERRWRVKSQQGTWLVPACSHWR
jgi:excinuclease ABC subunit A